MGFHFSSHDFWRAFFNDLIVELTHFLYPQERIPYSKYLKNKTENITIGIVCLDKPCNAIPSQKRKKKAFLLSELQLIMIANILIND